MCEWDLDDVVLRRDETGKPTVWCDPCIAWLVSALLDSGHRTLASCCGHGKGRPIVTYATGGGDRHIVIFNDQDEAMAATTHHQETTP